MNISIGIVGLPNVGKSSLFNTLTNLKIPAENYPFCTIEPNVGVVAVADTRLEKLSKIIKTEKLVPAIVEFHDIAGLVKNAHKGEGLGNSFLGNIRSTNIILHVIRNFKSSNVTHVENSVDPLRDKEIIETELILKDLESLESKIAKLEREVKADKTLIKVIEHFKGLLEHLSLGKLAVLYSNSDDIVTFNARRDLFLLTDKMFIYLINGDWEKVTAAEEQEIRRSLNISNQFPIILLNVKQEFELSILTEAERAEYLAEFALEYSGIEKLTRVAYQALGLISFFTAGEKEIHAWTIEAGSTIRIAAGAIHTDFTNKFIAADVVAFDDFISCGGWEGAKKAGKARLEGKEYLVKDGDVVIIKHGA